MGKQTSKNLNETDLFNQSESDSHVEINRVDVTRRRDPRGPVAEGAQVNARDRDGGGAASRSIHEDHERGPVEDDEGDGELGGREGWVYPYPEDHKLAEKMLEKLPTLHDAERFWQWRETCEKAQQTCGLRDRSAAAVSYMLLSPTLQGRLNTSTPFQET